MTLDVLISNTLFHEKIVPQVGYQAYTTMRNKLLYIALDYKTYATEKGKRLGFRGRLLRRWNSQRKT